MDPKIIQDAVNTSIAVPGALGIILAIATFAFMAWLVWFVMINNQNRENRYIEVFQKELSQQQAALARIEQAGTYQRDEHNKMIQQGEECIKSHQANINILERISGILMNGNAYIKKAA